MPCRSASQRPGSRMSIHGGFRLPSLKGHRMPPRTTQKSHRPRVSDRTMVGASPTRCFRWRLRSPRDKRNQMTPNAAQPGRKHRRAQAKTSAAANRGWTSEKILPRAVEGKCFYLTSPFIEPATRREVNGGVFSRTQSLIQSTLAGTGSTATRS